MIDTECLGGAVKINRVAAQTLFVAGIQRNAQIKLFFRHNLGMNFLKIIHIRKLSSRMVEKQFCLYLRIILPQIIKQSQSRSDTVPIRMDVTKQYDVLRPFQ